MNSDIEQHMQHLLDNLTKPVGSLGKLEGYALKLAGIQGRVPPQIHRKAVFVFAGDHGVVSEGVSLYPKDVTRGMALNILSGGAGINAIARQCGFDVFAVDAGIDGDPVPGIIDRRVARGSKNFLVEPAMTASELEACLNHGRELAALAVRDGYDLVAIGDMGIGNTTTAAAMCVAAGLSADAIVDRGTGIDDAMLAKKRSAVVSGVAKHAPYCGAKDILQRLGSFDFAQMAGFILGLKGKGVACMIDGFPVSSAAFIASLIDPAVTDYLFAGHRGKVIGHSAVLERMGLDPIVAFEMRLGEGTGAVIGGFMVELSARIANEMASFDSAGVSRSDGDERNF